MDTDTLDILIAAAERALPPECDACRAEARDGVWPARLWAAIDGLGLSRAAVGEDRGGGGLSLAAAGPLVGLAGELALPAPLVETILAAWLLDRAGLPVPDGPLTVALPEAGHRFRVSRGGDGWSVSGVAGRVPWGRDAAAIVLVGTAQEIDRVVLVERDGVTEVAHGRNLAGEPRDRLVLADAPARVGGTVVATDGLLAIGAVLRTMQIAAACRKALELAVDYANLRTQFGRPIGKFQVVQQSLAVMATETATARGAAALGSGAIEGRADPVAAAAAKIRAGEAAGQVSALAHQVFGAIGFTEEHPLHLLTRRLLSWRSEFGQERFWAERLGRHVFARGGNRLWPDLTAGSLEAEPCAT